MYRKYSVLHVDTPNPNNDRVCTLGISYVVDEMILWTGCIYVNPECEFDPAHTAAHGVDEAFVADAPIFPEEWDKIKNELMDTVVVSYDTLHHLNVIRKTLLAYGRTEKSVRYLDILPVLRRVFPDLESYDPDVVCRANNLEMCSRNAADISLGLGMLLCDFIPERAIDEGDFRDYPLGWSEETDLSGMQICPVGDFSMGDKDCVRNALEQLGAVCTDKVTLKTDILLIGDQTEYLRPDGEILPEIKRAQLLMSKQVKSVCIRVMTERALKDLLTGL